MYNLKKSKIKSWPVFHYYSFVNQWMYWVSIRWCLGERLQEYRNIKGSYRNEKPNSLHILQGTWPNYITYITLGKVLGTSVPFRSLLSLVSFVNFPSTVNFTYFLNFNKPLSQRTFCTESNQLYHRVHTGNPKRAATCCLCFWSI